MTSRQLSEWLAYSRVEPFGEERSDYRLAYALAVIASMFRGKEGPPLAVEDFWPHVGALAAAGSGEEGEDGEDGEARPPKHPNVILFERMMGVSSG